MPASLLRASAVKDPARCRAQRLAALGLPPCQAALCTCALSSKTAPSCLGRCCASQASTAERPGRRMSSTAGNCKLELTAGRHVLRLATLLRARALGGHCKVCHRWLRGPCQTQHICWAGAAPVCAQALCAASVPGPVFGHAQPRRAACLIQLRPRAQGFAGSTAQRAAAKHPARCRAQLALPFWD
jgi:hypothetical protein